VFEPIDIIAFDRKLHHSAAKLTNEAERRLADKHEKPTIKIVLNKNFEFKEKKEEP
jgi:hypothetical protein